MPRDERVAQLVREQGRQEHQRAHDRDRPVDRDRRTAGAERKDGRREEIGQQAHHDQHGPVRADADPGDAAERECRLCHGPNLPLGRCERQGRSASRRGTKDSGAADVRPQRPPAARS